MKLIVIYGAPASGKLTVAKAVAEKTGYKLFHNHATIDLLKELLEFGTPEFKKLNQQLRLDLLQGAARQGVLKGVIYTFVYDRMADDQFVEELQSIAQKESIDLQFIQIYCEEDELLKRVTGDSRKAYRKIHSAEDLSKYLKTGDFLSKISNVESLQIDSTKLTLKQTVEKVLTAIR